MRFIGKGLSKASVDEKKVDEIATRAIERIFPSKDAFVSALKSGKRQIFYLGIDPTGPTLHMGHLIPLLFLRRLQDLGHKVIVLMGDFTAMIGDPSDKASARKALTRSEVMDNLKLYKKQIGRVLSFSGSNKAEIKFNSKWLGRMSFEDVINLASKMTVQQMLVRDMFEKRMKEGRPIFIHEFLYPLMQGFDSVAMGVDGEVGGNDQTFNMLAGRDLMKSEANKEKFVVATKLLVDNSGKKMGKSEGNMVMFTDSPSNMFGKVMSWTDEMILPGFEYATLAPLEKVAEIRRNLESGANPKEMKMELAKEMVKLCYGEKEAGEAKKAFDAAFSKKEIPDSAEEKTAAKGTKIADILVETKTVSSKAEFKRLVSEKAIRDLKSDRAIENFDEVAAGDMDLKVGKHRFIKIRVR